MDTRQECLVTGRLESLPYIYDIAGVQRPQRPPLLPVRFARRFRLGLAGLRLPVRLVLRMRCRLRTMLSARPAMFLAARIMPAIIPPVIATRVTLLLLGRW